MVTVQTVVRLVVKVSRLFFFSSFLFFFTASIFLERRRRKRVPALMAQQQSATKEKSLDNTPVHGPEKFVFRSIPSMHGTRGRKEGEEERGWLPGSIGDNA